MKGKEHERKNKDKEEDKDKYYDINDFKHEEDKNYDDNGSDNSDNDNDDANDEKKKIKKKIKKTITKKTKSKKKRLMDYIQNKIYKISIIFCFFFCLKNAKANLSIKQISASSASIKSSKRYDQS